MTESPNRSPAPAQHPIVVIGTGMDGAHGDRPTAGARVPGSSSPDAPGAPSPDGPSPIHPAPGHLSPGTPPHSPDTPGAPSPDLPPHGPHAPGAIAVPGDTALAIGARRHLDAAALPTGARRVVLGPLAPALDAIAEHRARPGAGPVAVLASGDPGFFGITRALADRFGSAALRVNPGVPAVAAAFARIGVPWDDAVVVSAHGRDLRTAVHVCRAHPKVAVLTGPGAGPAELGLALEGLPRRFVVASDLGTPQESVTFTDPGAAARKPWSPTSVVLCLSGDPVSAEARTVAGPRPGPPGWALPEEAFSHRDSMVTKYEVRALALARLGPRLGDLVWDVGAGSGSVAVECARLGAAVVAVEKDRDGCRRVLANASAHGVEVQVVHGLAPGALDALPDPDAVFVGGGGHDVEPIVSACVRRARRTVVVTLAALDRVPGVRRALGSTGWMTDGVLLQSSRLAPLPGEVTRLTATNPVFVLWAHPPPDTGEARPAADVPATDRPAPRGPNADRSTADWPAAHGPVAETLATDRPAADTPRTEGARP